MIQRGQRKQPAGAKDQGQGALDLSDFQCSANDFASKSFELASENTYMLRSILDNWARQHSYRFVYDADPDDKVDNQVFNYISGDKDRFANFLSTSVTLERRARVFLDNMRDTLATRYGINHQIFRIAYIYEPDKAAVVDSLRTLSIDSKQDSSNRDRYKLNSKLLLEGAELAGEDADRLVHVLVINLGSVMENASLGKNLLEDNVTELAIAHELGHSLFNAHLAGKLPLGQLERHMLSSHFQNGIEHPYFCGLQFDFRQLDVRPVYSRGVTQSASGLGWLVNVLLETHAWKTANDITKEPEAVHHPQLATELNNLAGIYTDLIRHFKVSTEEGRGVLRRAFALLSFVHEFDLPKTANFSDLEYLINCDLELGSYYSLLLGSDQAPGSLRLFIRNLGLLDQRVPQYTPVNPSPNSGKYTWSDFNIRRRN